MLIYYRLAGTQDIWPPTMDGKGSARPFLQTPFAEASGVLSPDGRFLADQSDESGKFEVFVRTFESPDEKWQISNDGGRQPVWARNGREIFYRNGDKMMAVPIDTEPAFRPGRPVELF